ncbi:Macrophage colony-stimulating factor 1 receptor [Rhodosporidiobolus nylandii]
MSSTLHLVARDTVSSLRGSGPPSLNWLFVVECAVVLILVLFYFFYINRLLGLLASWILRLLLWKSTNSYFEIGGLQVSLLGGRIQFNDFRYISRNQSLRIVRGHITWKYWLRHVRSEEDKASESRVPCRVQVSLSGAEWFLYNRTPSYDAILEQLGLQEHNPLAPAASSPASDSSPDLSSSASKIDKHSRSASTSTGAASIEQAHHDNGEKEREKRRKAAEGKQGTDWLREALPIQVKCKKGAIILGNPSTPTIMIAGFEGVGGTYSAVKSRSALDAYKQVYHFTFEQPKIVFRTNPDYEEGMAAHGQTVMDRLDADISDVSLAELLRQPTRFLTLSGFYDLVRRRPRLGWRARRRAAKAAKKGPSSEPAHDKGWTGLPRYQTPEDDPSTTSTSKRDPLHPVEYAKVTTLVTSPEIEMTYYADVAGLVPEDGSGNARVAGLETHDVGNGDLSPEWGVDLVVRGGAITYGPWADRQRAKIQSAFMPATYFNGLETPRLQPGDQRMHTALKVFVEFSEGATMRIPTREASKDWKYDQVDSASYGETVFRPYGWLDVTLGPNSTMTYVLPMVATTAGYDTLLELHLDELSIASSVNYAPFLHAEACRIHCGLPSPLVWDEKRTWTINTNISRPDISLLRDHVTLFADVAKDWTSGPPGDYDHFVPFLYEMNVEVRDYVVQLYVNDHNIINNPTSPEDNCAVRTFTALLVLSGPKIDANVTIPSDEYRMECSNIKFGVDLVDLVLSMSLPDWNTHSAFLTDRTRTFATAPSLGLDGSYRFYSTAHPDNVEKLMLNVHSRDVVFKAMGWMIRHLLNLKDNYFGNFTHFVTLEEYRHRHERNLQGDPLELKYRPGQKDAFDVSVGFELENEIYDCSSAVALVLPQLQVDLRNHDYYMEMSLNIDPFRVIETSDSETLLNDAFAHVWEQQTDSLRVQGLEIGANRLFGPQPRTATYYCVWSIYVGSVVGSVPPHFLQALSRVGTAFGTTFSDDDNSLIPDFSVPLDPDATFLTVDIHSIDVAIRGNTTAIQLYLPRGVDVRFDDLASPPFLKHLSVDIPELTLRALAPLFGRAAPWMEVASLDADLSVVLGFSNEGWETRAREQLAFIALQDTLTKRCPFVYGQGRGAPAPNGRDDRLFDVYEEDESDTSSEDYGSESETSDDPEIAESPAQPLPTPKERLKRFDKRKRDGAAGSRTCIDFASWRGVGTDILSGINIDANLEHSLDDLYDRFLCAQDKLPKFRFSELEVAAAIPSLEVELIQDVLRPEDTISLHRSDNHAQDERGNATVLCTVQLVFSDIALEYRELEDGFGGVEHPTAALPSVIVERGGSASAGSTRLQVFHPEQASRGTSRRSHVLPPLPNRPRSRPTALDLSFSRCEAHLDLLPLRGLVSIVGGDARLDFVDEAAELIIGAVWSWRVVNDIVAPVKKREAEREAMLQHLVWAIMEASEATGLTSVPTFLNRVSYLVGSSATLRIDDGWKILHNLRHCLRLVPAEVHQHLARRDWPAPLELRDDVLQILQRRPTWDVDAEDLAHSSFLASLYGAPAEDRLEAAAATTSGLSWASRLAVELRSGSLDARFWKDGLSVRSNNRLLVGPVEAFLASSGLGVEYDELKIRARATLASLDAAVDRDLLVLVRHIVGVRRTFERKIQRFRHDLATSATAPSSATPTPSTAFEDVLTSLPTVVLDASVGVRSFGALAQADDLQAELVVADATASLFGRLEPRFGSRGLLTSHAGELNSSFVLGGVGVFAREVKAERDDVLLATELEGITSIFRMRGTRSSMGESKVEDFSALSAVQAVRLKVPRDAVRSYEFIENWKSSSLPTYDTLLTELRQGLEDLPSTASSAVSSSSSRPTPVTLFATTKLDVQLAIPLLELNVQAIPTLRASYALRNLSAFAKSAGTANPGVWLQGVDGGLHLGAQTVRFVPVLKDPARAPALPSETAFELPVIRLKAHVDAVPAQRVSLLASVDSFSVKLTTDILDNILTVQNHFGSDIDELVRVLRTKREAQQGPQEQHPTATAVSASPTPSPSEPLEWDARFALRGFKIAVQGPQAVQWVEAELLEALASTSTAHGQQRVQWQASVQNLALSLAQRTSADSSPSFVEPTDRRYRLAFFRLDLAASNAVINLPELPNLSTAGGADTPHLHLRLPRVHAVIQPIAIEALGDLVEHFVSEIQERRDSRKQEVEALHSRVFSTLDISEDDQNARSWLSSCVLSVEARSIGMAIPLSDEGVSSMTANRRRRAKSAQSRPAFLVSLPSVKFAAQKGSAGYARIDRFSAQFVPDFDQGRKEDFDGDTHQSLNRILLPEMQCTLRSPSNEPMLVHSKVSGLEVDVEPSIVAYSFALVDIYRLSHERFAKFAPEVAPVSVPLPPSPSSTSPRLPPSSPGLPSSVKATFEFASGAIRMHAHASKDEREPHPPSPSTSRPKHRRGKSLGDFASMRRSPGKAAVEAAPDIFRLPALSLWAEYQDYGAGRDQSRLHVDVVIHKSNNTLYPSLLPFVSSVARQLKERALHRSGSEVSASSALGGLPDSPTSPHAAASSPETPSFGGLALSISLRIDQSKLEISCLPAAEVTARLTWESGGFLLSTSPATNAIDFALTVDGVAAGLRHSFSPEDCLLAEAKGMTASVVFGRLGDPAVSQDRLLSVVVNLPDVAGEMNFRHLQDWLCLKAVWLDRMDLGPVTAPAQSTAPVRTKTSSPAVPSTSHLTTVVRAEIGSVRFTCDLGPAIGRITLVAEKLAARLRWVPEDARGFNLAIGGITVSAQGRTGGSLHVGGFWFATRLRDDQQVGKADEPDLLHIEIKLGKVDASIEYDFRRILVLTADPVEVAVTDDWSRARSEAAELTLGFQVKMGEFNVIGTTATVPTLLNVSNRVQVLIDEKAASADAALAAAGMQPRPTSIGKAENAISAVAAKFGRDSPTDMPECPVRIVNRLQIELQRIRVAIFPDHWNDGEVFRLDAGGGIRAQLVRGVDAQNVIQRELLLFLGFFSLRKINHRKILPSQEAEYDVHQWYALFRTSSERNIFKIGATEVKMDSEQAVGTYRLKHKFSMLFGGHVDVAFNYGLLRNLSTLASQYEMQMERLSGSAKSATGPTPSAHFTADPTAPLVPPPTAAAAEVAQTTISEDAIPKREGDVIKMKPMPLVQAKKGERRSLEFEAIEMDVKQPQLQVLGDATPPLEWIGLQRDRFPAFVHTGVTSPLEELLIVLSSTYGTQLARSKLSGKAGACGSAAGLSSSSPPPP